MNPTAASLPLQRPELGDSLEEFDLAADRAGFIGHIVLKPFEAARQSAEVGRIPLEQLLQEPDTTRAMGGTYKGGNYEFETWNYSTKEYGWKVPVDDRERKLYRHYLDADVYAAEICRDVVLRAREIRIKKKVYDTSVWTGASLTTAIGTPWSTIASADPVGDVIAAKAKVRASSGLMANAVIMGWTLWEKLRQCAKVIERIKYSGIDDPKKISVQMIAALFGVDHILIGGGVRNSAGKGLSASIADIWDKDKCMVAKIAVSGNVREPGIGRLFHWAEDGSSLEGTFESYRAEDNRSDNVRCRTETDEVIMYKEAGHLLTNCHA